MPRRGESTDPRARRTHAQLVHSAYILLRDTNSANLSVSSIVKAAGVSRQAFYEHFTSRNSLLLAVADIAILEPLVSCFVHTGGGTLDEDAIAAGVDKIASNRNVVLNLLNGPAGTHIYERCRTIMTPIMREVLRAKIGDAGADIPDESLRWTADFIIAGAVGVLVSVLRSDEGGAAAARQSREISRILDSFGACGE